MIISLIETLLYMLFFDLKGGYFYIGQMDVDPGGDFYLSLLYSRSLNPYSYHPFPYPPLLVLFCNFLGLFDRTETVLNADLSSFKETFELIFSKSFVFRNMFFLFSNFLLILLFYFIYRCLTKSKDNIKRPLLTSILLLCNSGLFCALVRGNLLLLCLLFLLMYLYFYNSSNEAYKNFSLICLALAFNVKPYAAVFGILLLYDKRYKDCLITVILSFLLFIIPFFFLQGGFIYSVKGFIKELLAFGGVNYTMVSGRALPIIFFKILNKIFHFNFQGKTISVLFSLALAFSLLIKGFYIKEHWKKVLIATLIMLIVPVNFGYIWSFMMLPILYFLIEEKRISCINILYLGSFLFLTAPFVGAFKYFSTLRLILCNCTLILLSLLIILDGFKLCKKAK